MKIVFQVMIFFISLIPGLPLVGLDSLMVLEKIDPQASSDHSVINLHFRNSVSKEKPEVEVHRSFFQLIFDKSVAAKPGAFYEGKGPIIRKVGVFQTGESEVTVRFFLSKDLSNLESSLTIEPLVDRYILSLDHSSLGNIPNVAAEKSEIKDTTVKWNFDLKNAAVVFASLILLLLFSLSLVRWKRNVKLAQEDNAGLSLQAISELSVGLKQKISLVRVGEEVFLLGISPEGVNLLSKIEEKDSSPKRAVQNSRVEEKRISSRVSSRPSLPGKAAKSVNYQINDDGIQNVVKNTEGVQKEAAINDITKMLRDKLQRVPNLSKG